ncbi:dihydroxyacetone kinase subunit DhaK [Proteiniclasticum sp.]|jgi:dihydroxyacetone kinase-like protein|uniref:dihydroxyacetone kinase subunit DhaK n=1 Tax=Proteiniclasticum sp. TaxID=2053595 RepID=UPI000E9A93F5|nr:dihydroxyacetone kinase subunit DhaK [Proteiniclasticum sp.]HBW12615.1 dihydroxyacetone kinase subunit DhaK [Proteiniclasticum sp.]
MRRLINDPYDVVEEMLSGYVKAHSDYVKLLEHDGRVVVTTNPVPGKVGVIIGGGSGHEPLFLGYVGKNFADAAVIGNINTSPSPEPCYNAVKAVDQGKGCIYLYGNYAGDVMNFDMGAEMAADDGIRVETVLVTDDVVSSENIEDRRGIAGDLFVFKAAAAAAAKGMDLDAVVAAAKKCNDNTRSMGVALSSSTIPVKGGTIFDMEDGDMEIGMGIHGEPGVRRGKIEPADQVVDEIMEHILKDFPLSEGDEVYTLVNGLGGLPLMDQYILHNHLEEVLREKGVKVYKSLVGNYATSMDMIGMGITIVKVDEELKELLDYPVDTPYMSIR